MQQPNQKRSGEFPNEDTEIHYRSRDLSNKQKLNDKEVTAYSLQHQLLQAFQDGSTLFPAQ